jgi:hypothetical protein
VSRRIAENALSLLDRQEAVVTAVPHGGRLVVLDVGE